MNGSEKLMKSGTKNNLCPDRKVQNAQRKDTLGENVNKSWQTNKLKPYVLCIIEEHVINDNSTKQFTAT